MGLAAAIATRLPRRRRLLRVERLPYYDASHPRAKRNRLHLSAQLLHSTHPAHLPSLLRNACVRGVLSPRHGGRRKILRRASPSRHIYEQSRRNQQPHVDHMVARDRRAVLPFVAAAVCGAGLVGTVAARAVSCSESGRQLRRHPFSGNARAPRDRRYDIHPQLFSVCSWLARSRSMRSERFFPERHRCYWLQAAFR